MQSLCEWLAHLYRDPDMLLMGHAQRAADLNLGLGWVYYGLARAFRPRTAVVIGSYRGFVPAVLARALADNNEGGTVHFIDPSLVDEFWTDPARVGAHFASLGLSNITHHLATTEAFAASPAFAALREIGLLFIDGYHTESAARLDLETFLPRLTPDANILFHDSIRVRTSDIYGKDKVYTHGVKHLMDALRADPAWQVMDLPLADGVTLVRRAGVVPPREVPPPLPAR